MAYTNQQLVDFQGDLVRIRDTLDTYLTTTLTGSDQYTKVYNRDIQGQVLEEWVYKNSTKNLILSVSKTRDFGISIRLSQDPDRS